MLSEIFTQHAKSWMARVLDILDCFLSGVKDDMDNCFCYFYRPYAYILFKKTL